MTCTTTEEIRREVRRKYAEAARSMAGRFNYATGSAGATALGYLIGAVGPASRYSRDVLRRWQPVGFGPRPRRRKGARCGLRSRTRHDPGESARGALGLGVRNRPDT